MPESLMGITLQEYATWGAKERLEEGYCPTPFVGRQLPPNRLDSILEHSRHLKTNVIGNLATIGKILMQYCQVNITKAEGQSMPTRNLAQKLEILLEKAAIILSDEEDSGSSSDDSSSTIEREQNRYGRLHCYIRCLMDLAPPIEKHISSKLYKVEEQDPLLENIFCVSQSALPFAMRVKDRFRDAPATLVERLVEANLERLIRIRRHEVEEPSKEDYQSPRPTQDDASTLLEPPSIFHDSGFGTPISTISHYAATVTSHRSFLSNVEEESQGRPRVPPLPRAGKNGAYFKCRYCRRTISMRNRIEWKMHVFADLQSYTCTHGECKDALKTFPSRKLWADHKLNRHHSQVQWRCLACNTTTITQQLFVNHLITSHHIAQTGHILDAVSEAKETHLKPNFKDHQCALCSRVGWTNWKAYATHVCQHLEEISLACLPRDEDNFLPFLRDKCQGDSITTCNS